MIRRALRLALAALPLAFALAAQSPFPEEDFAPVPVDVVPRPGEERESGPGGLPHLSPRAELARLDCTTEQRRREVTLFGGGTVRLREGVLGAEAAGLLQLRPEELTGFLNRLLGEDLSEVDRLERGLDGAWISRCILYLELPGRPRRGFTYGQYDSLPLNLSRVVQIVEELAAKVPDLKQAGRLPDDFAPRTGDLLRRQDGALFRVVGFTSDGKGIELEGQDYPLALYLSPEQLRHDFVALIRRDR